MRYRLKLWDKEDREVFVTYDTNKEDRPSWTFKPVFKENGKKK